MEQSVPAIHTGPEFNSQFLTLTDYIFDLNAIEREFNNLII